MFEKIMNYSIKHPRIIIIATLLVSILALTQFSKIKVDTDPENMLSKTSSARVFHSQMKKEFALYDLIVIGVVNKDDPDGVFNVNTLSNIYDITEDVKKIDGVISSEIISLSTKDNITQAGVGTVRFNWLMEDKPRTKEEALNIRDQAQDHRCFMAPLSLKTVKRSLFIFLLRGKT